MARPCFAYGSNLASRRLQRRVGPVGVLGVALLPGFHFEIGKRGRDGTGKANVSRTPEARVWGVLYSLDEEQWRRLDGFEAGYLRIRVEVEGPGERLRAETYTARQREPGLLAAPSYKQWIVSGAREHGLPAPWIDFLCSLPAGAAGGRG